MTTPPDTAATPAPRSRVALVTGAARRLGRAIAIGLAGAGWDVAVHYRSSRDDALATVAGIEALGRRALAVQADLCDETATVAMFDSVESQFGAIGCLVNNASRFAFDRPETFGYGALAAHLAPNLAAPVLLASRLHAAVRSGEQAVVINLLDQKLENLNPDYFSYTLTKAALLAATRMMAMSFAPRLRVVGVSPGITLPSGSQSQSRFAQAHAMAPLGRSSLPADIVAAVVFLADAHAITGVDLAVDGGQHLIPLARDVDYAATAGRGTR
ncbi:MAG: SDR family oxidoreductase [Burkholderiaceae bacterium]|nr:SDR family oxidoreductase [Burkholderiaceae bacterium]